MTTHASSRFEYTRHVSTPGIKVPTLLIYQSYDLTTWYNCACKPTIFLIFTKAKCGQFYSNTSTLKAHQHKLHQLPTFLCELCGERFQNHIEIRRHQHKSLEIHCDMDCCYYYTDITSSSVKHHQIWLCAIRLCYPTLNAALNKTKSWMESQWDGVSAHKR